MKLPAKKQCNVDLNDSRVVYKAYSESGEPKRLVRCWNNVERKYIQEQQQINYTVTTITWVLPTKCSRTRPSTGLVSE